MPAVVVVGAQWGDEGKGKVVDILAEHADIIVRYQGGNNAGHTLVVDGQKTVLHLVPSGGLHAGKVCVIGNGVVVDPGVLLSELDALRGRGYLLDDTLLKISDRAHVIIDPDHWTPQRLTAELAAKGLVVQSIETVESSLEDVFTLLAHRGKSG